MLEIRLEAVESVTVATLSGRLDGAGAMVFDREIGAATQRGTILDVSGVSFLSSAGVRSLLKLERSLRAKGLASVLVAPQPLVVQVLEISGLLGQLRRAASLDEARAQLAAAAERAQAIVKSLGGRCYRVTRLAAPAGRLESWGGHERLPAPEQLECLTLAELGLAAGIGGLGGDRAQATAALGPFVSTGNAFAIAPADGSGAPDYLITERPAESAVYVASATGVSGTATLAIATEGEPTIAELRADVGRLLADLGHDAGPAAVLALAEAAALEGCVFATSEDLASGRRTPLRTAHEPVLVLLPLSGESAAHAVRLSELPAVGGEDVREALAAALRPETVNGVVELEDSSRLANPRLWVFVAARVAEGRSRLLGISVEGGEELPDEWRLITRRIYTDAAQVVLSPLSGGYSARTFRVTSLDAFGRRMIPTVLKISTLAFTDREERAYHEHVKRFILNNTTVIMGRATQGSWAGLRYNFVGINGPDSRLAWLADHYQSRPVEQILPIFDRLFGEVLWPWYGQTRRQVLRPYAEHDPTGLFPSIAADAQSALGVRPDQPTIDCPELGVELPNPYRFLGRELRERHDEPFETNTAITHGDLNPNNVLLDEKENLYVIDFSETRPRCAIADFARLEPLLSLQLTRLRDERDLAALTRFFAGLVGVGSLREVPPLDYDGDDPMVPKAHAVVKLLRRHAAAVSGPHDDMLPYLLTLLQWTVPMVSFRQLPTIARRLSMYCSALVCRRLLAVAGARG